MTRDVSHARQEKEQSPDKSPAVRRDLLSVCAAEYSRQIECGEIDGVNEKRCATSEEITTGSDDGNGDLQCVCVFVSVSEWVSECV